jgi:DNA polymerase IV
MASGQSLRKIIHIDMDAFFAAVEQRDNPQYLNKPVIVGGKPDSRGVVATCSYEARKFGIHSAMPSSQAYRLCPQAIFVKPRFEVYKEASAIIRRIFSEYTELFEPLSLDEAYLDVTDVSRCQGSATLIAREIKQKIRQQTGLIASAGISYNKFLAKIASDMDKPDGLYLITPEQGPEFVEQLAVGKFNGIGKDTEKKMHTLGIKTGNDLKKWFLPLLALGAVIVTSRNERVYQLERAGITIRPEHDALA